MSAIRTVIAGGILFVLPFGLVVFLLGELLDIALLAAQPLASLFPAEDIFGRSVAAILAWVLIVLGCYLAGLLARWSIMSGASERLGGLLANIVPGYQQIRGSISEYLTGDEATSKLARPVRVKHGNMVRIGFEVSRHEETQVALVFLPNTPDPFSGIVVEVEVSNLDPIPGKATEVMRAVQFYGRGLPTTTLENQYLETQNDLR